MMRRIFQVGMDKCGDCPWHDILAASIEVSLEEFEYSVDYSSDVADVCLLLGRVMLYLF